MKISFFTIGILALFFSPFFHAQQNVSECFEKAQKLHRFSFIESDNIPIDTVVDLKNGYVEISNSDLTLCQATKFSRVDKSSLLLISGHYGDMQCSNFPFYAFEIDKNGDSCASKNGLEYFSNLKIQNFLTGDSVMQIVKKYLPALKENYLDLESTEIRLLNEFYDYHFILPRYGTTIEVTLTVCDYIPTNELEIPEWDQIENSIQTLYFKFNKKTGLFEQTSKK